MSEQRLEIGGISLSHPEKVLYPEQGITKSVLADYYLKIAPRMLLELKGRPVSLVRCPQGRARNCFFQKHPDVSMAGELKTIPIKEKTSSGDYLLIGGARDLVYLVQMNVLEIHCWGSRKPKIEFPDRIIFDLDPHEAVPSSQVVKAAKTLRGLLLEVHLQSFVKTSGGKGLHVVVPIKQVYSWDQVKGVSHAVADALVATDPKSFLATASKEQRVKKIFVDYLRNGRGATSIANYSTRARENAPIAVPLRWDELKPGLKFNSFNVSNIFRRFGAKFRDPWEEISEMDQKLPAHS